MKLLLSGAIALVVMGNYIAAADTEPGSEAAAVVEVVTEAISEIDASTAGGQADGEGEAEALSPSPDASMDAASAQEAEASPQREEYSPGYDFNAALASHVIVEQTAGILDDLMEATQQGSDRRASSLLHSLDVLSLAFPEFDHVALSASAQDPADLSRIKEKWLAADGETKGHDLSPTDGVVGRALVMVSDYLTDVYLPRLTELREAEDPAQAEVSPANLYLHFLGVQTIIALDAEPKYDTISLYGTLDNAAEIAKGLNLARKRLEAVRRLMVEVRKGTLTPEKQDIYKEQLSVVADEIQTFATLLRRSASNG